jgi:ABC-type antimicrobial peptide transport system permease subunit
MDELLGLIFEIIFAWPGAFVRWLIFYRHKRFKDVLIEDGFKNISVGVIALMTFVGLVYTALSVYR